MDGSNSAPEGLSRPGARGLHGRVAHDLGVAIVSGRHQPGEILPNEISSSEQLKVSRGAYREAIRILSAKGLVTAKPKMGTQVNPRVRWNLLDPEVLGWMFETEPSQDFIRDLFELRLVVEPAAAGYAAQRRSEAELARMKSALADMARFGVATPEGRLADQTFHNLILEAARNAPLMALAGTIAAAVSWTTIFKARRNALPRDSMPPHWAVYEAIAEASPDEARACMTDLILGAFHDTEVGLALKG